MDKRPLLLAPDIWLRLQSFFWPRFRMRFQFLSDCQNSLSVLIGQNDFHRKKWTTSTCILSRAHKIPFPKKFFFFCSVGLIRHPPRTDAAISMAQPFM